jgi:hypothetical protein
VAPVRVPAPDPMLHVTPALDESLVTVAVKACVAPPLRAEVPGLTLTEMDGGGGGADAGEEPLLQPGRKVKARKHESAAMTPLKTLVRTRAPIL